MQDGYRTRLATPADADLIASHRTSMFVDMGDAPLEEYDSLREATQSYIVELLELGEYLGWIVEVQDRAVASGGLYLRQLAPMPGRHRIVTWAHIANIYTEPAYRRRGIALTLMRAMLDYCAVNQMDQVTLVASPDGRPLYESLGFHPTADMKLVRQRL